MATEIITQEDLQNLREELILNLAKLIKEAKVGKPDYLTQEEVLDMLKVSPNTLRGFRENYGLPYHRLGNKVYYTYSDVVRMMEKNKNYF